MGASGFSESELKAESLPVREGHWVKMRPRSRVTWMHRLRFSKRLSSIYNKFLLVMPHLSSKHTRLFEIPFAHGFVITGHVYHRVHSRKDVPFLSF